MKRYYDLNGWLFIAPSILLIAVFLIYPIFRSLYLSFFTGKGMMMKFGGFANIVKAVERSGLPSRALTNTTSSSSCRCRS